MAVLLTLTSQVGQWDYCDGIPASQCDCCCRLLQSGTEMNAHILIADDDEVSCQLFAETLEDEGCRVKKVFSGDQALVSLGEDDFDLLITDVRMPGLSGLDVTRIVHEKYPSLPIIVMTAFGSIETAVEAIHEGAFDFISKPMNLGGA